MDAASPEIIAQTAKAAFQSAQLLEASERVRALDEIAKELESAKAEIIAANKTDLDTAKAEVDAGRMSDSLLKRLDLTRADKWDAMVQGVRDVAALPDPTGRVSYAKALDEGLDLYRVSCPIGVLLVIFEARPEVVVNIAALAIKSGNAAILKGGKESTNTATLLSKAIQTALSRTQLPLAYVQTVHTRAEVSALLSLDKHIDLVIPRGSNALVSHIKNNTRIPVMGHADGLCAVYIDESANADKAIRVVVDSKIDYPAACNAAETLLLHESITNTIWPRVAEGLMNASVTLLCDPPSLRALAYLSPPPPNMTALVRPAPEDAFDTEHLSLTLSVAVVPTFSAAVEHINKHGSHHTDCIVTEDQDQARAFCRGVDSAGTFVNASTRFADGFRYGFGTEVGIATGRIHARGPVGLEGLVTYKYVLKSGGEKGHIVGEFGSGNGQKKYKHTDIPMDVSPI